LCARRGWAHCLRGWDRAPFASLQQASEGLAYDCGAMERRRSRGDTAGSSRGCSDTDEIDLTTACTTLLQCSS
jgi:hypothetical protein